jgi:hypothetical protein
MEKSAKQIEAVLKDALDEFELTVSTFAVANCAQQIVTARALRD